MQVYPQSITEGKKFKYNFWKNKPVQQFETIVVGSKSIEDITQRKVYSSDEPIKLPASMKWVQLDMNLNNDSNNNPLLDDVVNFLNEYYVLNDKFGFNFTKDFLKWTLGND